MHLHAQLFFYSGGTRQRIEDVITAHSSNINLLIFTKSATVMLKFSPLSVVDIKVKCGATEEGRTEPEAGKKKRTRIKNVR